MKFAWSHSALVAGGVAALLALTACSSGDDPAADGASTADGTFAGDTLTVWFPGTNEAEMTVMNDSIVPAFEKETGAKVETTFVDWGDISPKLNAAFAAGAAPDLFGHGASAAADFVANERLEPLDDRFAALDQADRDDLSTALASGVVDEKQYYVPLTLDGNLLVYRADLLADAGIDPDSLPDTWEGIAEVGQQLTERDGSGAVTRAGLLLPTSGTSPQQTFAALIAGAGGQQISDDGTSAAFNTPAGLTALEYFTSLYDADEPVSSFLGEDYTNLPVAQQPLVTGEAVIAMETGTMAQQISAANPDLDLRVIQPLKFEGTDQGAALGGGGLGLMMNADSTEKDLAWEFLTFLLSPENSLERAEAIGAVPVRTSQADSSYVTESKVLPAFIEARPSYISNPNIEGWVQVRDALMPSLNAALLGETSPGDALDEAEQAVNDVLSGL